MRAKRFTLSVPPAALPASATISVIVLLNMVLAPLLNLELYDKNDHIFLSLIKTHGVDMKCIHCGANNPSETKFCAQCGKPLSNALTCPKCRKEVPRKSNFCPHCGSTLRGSRKKPRGQAQPVRKSGKMRMRDMVLAAVLIAALGAGVIGIWYSQQTRPSSPSLRSPIELPSFTWSREVESIAALFNCPCGNCDLNLAKCTCDNPKGSVEIKSYINSLLRKNTSREEVIKQVEKRYGSKI